MSVYLVRHIESKEVQGIFWGTLAEIWDAFDEMGDPLGFEFAKLKPGALFTCAPIGKGRAAMQFAGKSEDAGDELESFSWDGFSPSETLWEALHYQDELHWQPFDASDQGHGLVARIVRAAR